MNVIGFDDAPFSKAAQRVDVPLVGVVTAGGRVDGLLVGRVRRDGANSTRVMAALVSGSKFRQHVRAVLLQGIAVGGFNVVDVHALHRMLGIPVLVVARRQPDLVAIRAALSRLRAGARRLQLIERAGPMQPLRGVWVQTAGLSPAEAEDVLAKTTVHGSLPEALRVAHLVAGAMVTGVSRGRA